MKTVCIINFLALIFVLICNFELTDLPYFKAITQNAFINFKAIWFKAINYKEYLQA
jgi:hypothetical protein